MVGGCCGSAGDSCVALYLWTAGVHASFTYQTTIYEMVATFISLQVKYIIYYSSYSCYLWKSYDVTFKYIDVNSENEGQLQYSFKWK